MKGEILIECLCRGIGHVLHVIRSNSHQNLQGGKNISILILVNVLMHLIERFIDIMGVALLFNLNERQPVYEKCSIETTISLPCYNSRSFYLIYYLIYRVARSDLL